MGAWSVDQVTVEGQLSCRVQETRVLQWPWLTQSLCSRCTPVLVCHRFHRVSADMLVSLARVGCTEQEGSGHFAKVSFL